MANPSESWADRVERANGRWEAGETEVSVEHWRQMATQRAGAFGTPEWHAAVRRASRRSWLRHPLKMARASCWTWRAKRQRGRG